MEDALISQVRSFNRVVTQRVGALHDRFLARDRSLGESRMLWEIGLRGQDVRSLRVNLDLDSGYVSRLLRSLEAAGLVTVEPEGSDKRVRRAQLTSAGKRERAILDRRSDELAASLLEHLTAHQRTHLVESMVQVERLLTAAIVRVERLDPSDPQAKECLAEYFCELERRFEAGFDPALSIPADEEELRPPAGVILAATLRSRAIGCGALKFHQNEPAEIKRMWVAESARGLGVGRRLLTELETYAADNGTDRVRLETNRALVEAIRLYRSAGYAEVAPFNNEPYAHHWFEKDLRPS